MKRGHDLTLPNKFSSMIVMDGWMFIDTFFKFRSDFLDDVNLYNLLHMPYEGRGSTSLGINFGTTLYTIRNEINSGITNFQALRHFETDEDGTPVSFPVDNERRSSRSIEDLKKISGFPIAYWISDNLLSSFKMYSALSEGAYIQPGLQTSNNDRFVRQWSEVNVEKSRFDAKSNADSIKSGAKWFPYLKGGDYRPWYGNMNNIVNWEDNGSEIKNYVTGKYPYLNGNIDYVIKDRGYYFKPSLTWTRIGRGNFCVRQSFGGTLFDVAGSCLFPEKSMFNLYTGFLCSKIANEIMLMINPTINTQSGDLEVLPVNRDVRFFDQTEQVVVDAIQISKTDWDNFETSWDFQTHPLLRSGTATAAAAFADWQAGAEAVFRELQRLETENNRYWIDAYGLGEELTPEVPDEQITIRRADLGRDVRSLLSYAVGCMMGRYSLDEPGLIHAGQPFDPARHTRFAADRDGILPVTLDGYFDDDVTARLAEFLRVAYGPETVAQNMEWLAAGLGGQKAGESAEARIRRYFATEFMSDHLQTYKKRPIYWLFTSGKKRGFGALVYLHRYDAGTLARLRTDYLMPLQRTLDAELERATGERDTAGSTALKKVADKRVKDLSEQIAEVYRYDDSLKHAADLKISLELDDGVAYNYWLMGAAGQEYLTGKPIKGLQDLVYTGTDLKLADLERKSQWKRDLLAQEQEKEIKA